MATLKVRFIINQGRHGAPLAKLGRIAEQVERFLRALAQDNGVEAKPGEWLAANFKNGSVEYDAEFHGDVSLGSAQTFVRSLEFLADYDPDTEGLNGMASDTTALEYAKIGSLIDPDETIAVGVYPARGGQLKWRQITYHRSSQLRRQIEQPIPSYGSVQGILHAWFKEARDPYFTIRELSTDSLVKVLYSTEMYGSVARAVQERTAMLIASGNMLYDRGTRAPVEVRADRLEPIKMLSSAEFEAFFGSEPNFTAALSDYPSEG